MPHLFLLLVKINLVLLVFAATYYFWLRKLTFYVINRVFLLFGIFFSTLYPFVDLTEFFYRQNLDRKLQDYVPNLSNVSQEIEQASWIHNFWNVLSLVFFVGVFVMAIRFAVQLLSLYKIHSKSKKGVLDNYPVRILAEDVSPFSFWKSIYINPALHGKEQLEAILAHEHIHVKQLHTLDILLAELSVVFYWFNPGVWLMKKAVKENLEFITDKRIISNGIDRKRYQYSLLDVGQLRHSVQFVNNFNLSDLKQRIKMMNARPSSKLKLSLYVLLLPVILITTLAFTISKKEMVKSLAPVSNIIKQINLNPVLDQPKTVEDNLQPAIAKASGKSVQEVNHTVLEALHTDLNAADSLKGTLNQKEVKLYNNVRKAVLKASNVLSFQTRILYISDNEEGNRDNEPDKNETNAKKVVMVRGYKMPVNKEEGVDFFIKGVRVDEGEVKKLNIGDIKSVTVVKKEEPAKIGEIYIEMKKQ
ncbi:M56 family metallopeptidase [Pedobacter montanisoli]|uniref:Peptidase M56 domain-containing protein n=1 Tax=Pedobacter montanisoli TaxID=2923277 RepID=A0ABS9ZXQ2_9SPHI|nr:M56 family metallopeptidase [Pedobacter montanisoli]MCJ0743106.1 hypothetical protein [Pedobacter montanisoli]